MPYTTEEGGRLNNFAIEPKMYVEDAKAPSKNPKLLIAGGVGLVLMVGLIVLSAVITQAG